MASSQSYIIFVLTWCVFTVNCQKSSINDIVLQSSNAATFAALWGKAGTPFLRTTATSTSGIPYTVFVPIDSAFAKLSSSQMDYINSLSGVALNNFLNYHVLPQVSASLLASKSGYLLQNLANYGTQYGGTQLTYRRYSSNFVPPSPGTSYSSECVFISPYGTVYVNNALIVQADKLGSDGVVHYIDTVLFDQESTFPMLRWLSTPVAPIVGIVQYTFGCPTDQCSQQFVSYLQQSNDNNPLQNVPLALDWITSTLTDLYGAVTIFVPNQAAFDVIPSDKLAALTNNPSQLANVVLGHIFSGRVLYTNPMMNATNSPIAVTSTSWKCGPYDSSVANPAFSSYVQSCTVFYTGGQMLADNLRVQVGRTSAKIVRANVPVLNGVVHIIDRLLGYVYQDCWSLLGTYSDYSQFYNAVNADSLIKQYVSSSTATVFAPNNAAFSAALTAAGGSFNSTMMRRILMLHIVLGNVRSFSSIGDSAQSDTNAFGTTVRYVRSVDATRVESGFGNGFISGRVVLPDLACTNGVAHGVDAVFGISTLTIMQFVQGRSELNQTAYRLVDASQSFLNNPNVGPYTLFAPTDLAWQYLSKIAPNVDQTYSLRVSVMRRHVLAGNVQLMNTISLSTVFSTPYGQLTIKQVSNTWTVQYSRTVSKVIINDYLCKNGLVHTVDTVLYAVEDNYITGASCVDPAHCASTALQANALALIVFTWLAVAIRR